jgi:hypothetical protein
MPDLAVCNSTVCPVRKNCERNWDSGIHKADRDPKIQEWYPDAQKTHDPFCPGYMRVKPSYEPDFVVSGTSVKVRQTIPLKLDSKNVHEIRKFLAMLYGGSEIPAAAGMSLQRGAKFLDAINNVPMNVDVEVEVEVMGNGRMRLSNAWIKG